MRKVIMLCISAVLYTALHGVNAAYSQEICIGKDGSVRNISARSAIINGNISYLATKKELYKTDALKKKWESIFYLPAGENEITCLWQSKDTIFVGTKKGVFRSYGGGVSWDNIFRTIMPGKNSALCITSLPGYAKGVLVGTEKGIFVSEDEGDSWKDISGVLKNRPVRCIMAAKEYMYAGTDSGLYRRKNGNSDWERIVAKGADLSLKEKNEEPSYDFVELEEEAEPSINCITKADNKIYVGLDKGILVSEDDGSSWHDFTREGLSGSVNQLLYFEEHNTFYCGTTNGIFELTAGSSRWQELYKGLDRKINATGLVSGGDDKGLLWAVADSGLYKIETGFYVNEKQTDLEKSMGTLKVTFSSEPSIKELQRAAMDFADVNPEKIKKWQSEARLRALLPKVSFNTDKSRSTNYEIYTSASKDYVVMGPDDISNGWDASVSWELGDIIWSDDQANIDVRSRLTTQLRNDILDDLRRLYFERKRLQFELMMNAPKDMKMRYDKELRLEELTQGIDDLTGNYLSDNMRKSN